MDADIRVIIIFFILSVLVAFCVGYDWKNRSKMKMTRIKHFWKIFRTTKNWLQVVMVWFGLKSNVLARFRNGQTFPVHKKDWYDFGYRVVLFYKIPSAKITGDTINFLYKGKSLTFKCGRYGWNIITEIFNDGYEEMDTSGKVILDVGSMLGETAIWSLMNGAKYVYGVEINPECNRLAKENIKQNGFSDKCELLCAAVDGENGSVSVDFEKDMTYLHSPKNDGVPVPKMTISDLVKKYNLDGVVLKMDIEGYEYEAILNTPKEVLRKFSSIFMEYHYGYERLVPYLIECGFDVEADKPVTMETPHLNKKEMQMGMIYAI